MATQRPDIRTCVPSEAIGDKSSLYSKASSRSDALLARVCPSCVADWTAGLCRSWLTLLVAVGCGLLLLVLLLLLLLSGQPLLQLPQVTVSAAGKVTAESSSSEPVSTRSGITPTSTPPADVTSIAAVYVPVAGGCVPGPVISTHSEYGRLGNTMAEYASIFALGRRYNITAVTPRSLLYLMRHAFLNLTMPVVFEYCLLDDKRVTAEMFEKVPDKQKHAHSWEIVNYAHRIRLFWQYRDLLRREFRFRPELTAGAQQQLRDVAKNRTNITFVGVHVRRTDYRHHLWVVLGGYMLNESFYLGAMDLCRSRYHQPVLFIVTSDDLN